MNVSRICYYLKNNEQRLNSNEYTKVQKLVLVDFRFYIFITITSTLFLHIIDEIANFVFQLFELLICH